MDGMEEDVEGEERSKWGDGSSWGQDYGLGWNEHGWKVLEGSERFRVFIYRITELLETASERRSVSRIWMIMKGSEMSEGIYSYAWTMCQISVVSENFYLPWPPATASAHPLSWSLSKYSVT